MKELDMRGVKCPLPIVKLGAAIRQMAPGEEVRVLADDKGFVPDVQAWSDKTGHELVSLDTGDATRLVAVVRKSA